MRDRATLQPSTRYIAIKYKKKPFEKIILEMILLNNLNKKKNVPNKKKAENHIKTILWPRIYSKTY